MNSDLDNFFKQAREIREAAQEFWSGQCAKEDLAVRKAYLHREGYLQGRGSLLRLLADKVLSSNASNVDKQCVNEELRQIRISCNLEGNAPVEPSTPQETVLAASKKVLNMPIDCDGRPEVTIVDPDVKEDLPLGTYGKRVIVRANQSLDMVYLKDVGEFYIPSTNGILWKVIRLLAAADADGYVDLNVYKGFQGSVGGRYGKAPPNRKAKSAYEFLRYIHPEGTSGRYRIEKFPKRRRNYSRRIN